MPHTLCLTFCLLLTACIGYNIAALSGDPVKMSADTLCYRYANDRDEKLGAEIARRNLDCAAVLARDPLYQSGRP